MKDYIEELIQARQGHKELQDKVYMLESELKRIREERVYFKQIVYSGGSLMGHETPPPRYISRNQEEIQQDFDGAQREIDSLKVKLKEEEVKKTVQEFHKKQYRDFIKRNPIIKLLYKFSWDYFRTADDDPMGKRRT